MSRPPTKDPYGKRRAAGTASREQTRQRLLSAADELFRRDGYPATTVAAIAARAGVSLQTLYLAWGSKRALLRAATDAAAAATSAQPAPGQWNANLRSELDREAGADPSAEAYLVAVAGLHAQVAERTAPYWRMHQQAAATDPELAADWQAIQQGRRDVLAQVTATLPERGRRPGLQDDEITDTLWAVTGLEVHDLLTVGRGYTTGQFRAWLERTLVAVVCAGDADPPRAEPKGFHHPVR